MPLPTPSRPIWNMAPIPVIGGDSLNYDKLKKLREEVITRVANGIEVDRYQHISSDLLYMIDRRFASGRPGTDHRALSDEAFFDTLLSMLKANHQQSGVHIRHVVEGISLRWDNDLSSVDAYAKALRDAVRNRLGRETDDLSAEEIRDLLNTVREELIPPDIARLPKDESRHHVLRELQKDLKANRPTTFNEYVDRLYQYFQRVLTLAYQYRTIVGGPTSSSRQVLQSSYKAGGGKAGTSRGDSGKDARGNTRPAQPTTSSSYRGGDNRPTASGPCSSCGTALGGKPCWWTLNNHPDVNTEPVPFVQSSIGAKYKTLGYSAIRYGHKLDGKGSDLVEWKSDKGYPGPRSANAEAAGKTAKDKSFKVCLCHTYQSGVTTMICLAESSGG